MKRLLVVPASLSLLLAVAAPAGASASPPDIGPAGVRKCSDTRYATYVRARRLNCRRARQVAQSWETHGRCPGGWRFSNAGSAPPNTGSGGSLLRCTKRGTRSSVTWVESEASGD